MKMKEVSSLQMWNLFLIDGQSEMTEYGDTKLKVTPNPISRVDTSSILVMMGKLVNQS